MVGVILAAGIIILGADYVRSKLETEGTIERNAYGQGSKMEKLEAAVEGEAKKIPVEIEVAEQNYTSEEVQELFDRVIRQMETLILGDNESLDHIENDMNLMTKIPDEPIEISWELDRYDVMNVRGELQTEVVEETLVKLSAILTYSENEEEQALYQCVAKICPKTLSAQEKSSQQLKDEIQKQEEENRSQKILKLPETLRGKRVAYYKKMDRRGIVLIVMAVLIGVLLYAMKIQNLQKEQEKKKQQMLLDYPEIINKITLFIGAGMTVKRAWKKIVEDYEHQKEIWGVRYAYEEMGKACREMGSGITEAESYENFGRRCNEQVYIRFGALLSQNLRKGTKGLTQLLKLESIQAFEERKARAKRLGEEASTKLLLPMFLMLAIVLVIAIVPAFLSMQI